jgi:hypothetical protein
MNSVDNLGQFFAENTGVTRRRGLSPTPRRSRGAPPGGGSLHAFGVGPFGSACSPCLVDTITFPCEGHPSPLDSLWLSSACMAALAESMAPNTPITTQLLSSGVAE